MTDTVTGKPADTTMMGVVHDALRRDLARLHGALAANKNHNVKGKSISQLATEGHWLMDGLDQPRYQVLVHLVPPPARLVIVKGFARRYRRACAVRWGTDLPVGPLADRS